MNRLLLVSLAAVVPVIAVPACRSAPPDAVHDVERLRSIVRLQGTELESLVRALADAQRAAANANWFLLENSAEQALRARDGIPDDATLSETNRLVVREEARLNLGKLLGYIDAKEEDLLRLIRASTESWLNDPASGADSVQIVDIHQLLDSVAEDFDAHVIRQVGYGSR